MQKLTLTGESGTVRLIQWLHLDMDIPKAMVVSDVSGRVQIVPFGRLKFIEDESWYVPEMGERAPEPGERMTIEEWAEMHRDKSHEKDDTIARLNGIISRKNKMLDAVEARERYFQDKVKSMTIEIEKLKTAKDNTHTAEEFEAMRYEVETADKQVEALESLVKRWMAYAWGKGDTAENTRAGRLYDDSHRALFC
jgi:hypothetical protein